MTLRRMASSHDIFVLRSNGVREAVSSRGLGRSPLKAETRVRIPLPLWSRVQGAPTLGTGPHRLAVRTPLFQGGDRGSTPLGGTLSLPLFSIWQ